MRLDSNTTLLGIWAHPDDESYLSAGLMLRAVEAGARVVCVTATAGERGAQDPGSLPPNELAFLRAAELRDALRVLGVTEHRILGLPDGGCCALDHETGSGCIAPIFEEIDPTVVVTFGPDGITGHPDHIAVNRWVTQAWASGGARAELLYATVTHLFVRRFRRIHVEHGLFPPGFPKECDDDEVVIEVRLEGRELSTKRAALAAHRSQTTNLAEVLGEHTFRRWWDTESFRRPRPSELARFGELHQGPAMAR